MAAKLCKGCAINPMTGKCQYGGPYNTAPEPEHFDERPYIKDRYGLDYENWDEYLGALRGKD